MSKVVSWLNLSSKKAKALEDNLLPYQLRATDMLDGSLILDGFNRDTSDVAFQGNFSNISALINEYRDMSADPDVDMAIDDIINAIVTCQEDEIAVDIDFSNVDIGDKIASKIRNEFINILDMLDFNENGYERIRQWYVDGRQYIQPVLDETRPKNGISKLMVLDSRTVQKVKLVDRKFDVVNGERKEVISGVRDIYIYNPYWAPEYNNVNGFNNMPTLTQTNTRVLDGSALIYAFSGIKDPVTGVVISDLEKAKKPLNNLRMMRDSQVIYRLTRSTEKRVFNVDVGTLPAAQADEQIKKVMARHKTKLTYDPKTGKVNGKAHQAHMLEDFYLPTREGGRGSSISTIAGAQNLSEIDDILYFQKLLYRSLNTPEGRLENNQAILFGNRNQEMTRDEWKFNKFVGRKRKRYGQSVFMPLLKLQLSLKGIMTKEEFEETLEPRLNFKWRSDSWVEDQQETDQLLNRFNNMSSVEPYEGQYVSREWVYENILRFTPEEIKREKERIKQEEAEKPKPEPEDNNGLGI